MKKTLVFAIIALFALNCAAFSQKTKTKKNAPKKTTATLKRIETPRINPSIKGKNQVERPLYEITVSQNGVEMGKIMLETYTDLAPLHAKNFDSLVSVKFYDGTAFHRVIPGFMIQGGDPNSREGDRATWGMGSPDQTRVPAEFSATLKHKRGILSAARTPDPNSATSQFFICHADIPHLDGQYSIYGEVVEGMDVVDKIANAPRDARDNPNDKISMMIKRVK
ncbi:MAG: peptidylprolyl isomerase [Chloroflexota bacterium]